MYLTAPTPYGVGAVSRSPILLLPTDQNNSHSVLLDVQPTLKNQARRIIPLRIQLAVRLQDKILVCLFGHLPFFSVLRHTVSVHYNRHPVQAVFLRTIRQRPQKFSMRENMLGDGLDGLGAGSMIANPLPLGSGLGGRVEDAQSDLISTKGFAAVKQRLRIVSKLVELIGQVQAEPQGEVVLLDTPGKVCKIRNHVFRTANNLRITG